MDRIEITAEDFIVTVPHGREAGQDLVTDTDDVDVVERWQANSAIIDERRSPAAVAVALVELLQFHPIPEEELAALRWLRDQLNRSV